MTPHIGVLTVKGGGYHPTQRLAEAAAARNAVVIPINPYGVLPAYARGRPFLQGNPEASNFRALLPRQGAEIKAACLPLIAHYEQMGVRVINGLYSIQIARNKFFMLQALTRAKLPIPDTIFAASIDGCRQAREHFAPAPTVLKPISGRQGVGLHCLSPNQAIPHDLEMQITAGRGVLVQAYIPVEERQDFRVLVIGKEVAGAIRLKPAEGDFRANLHLGGQPAPASLSRQVGALALRAAAATQMEIAGVDLILDKNGGPVVIEINSAPGFRGMESATGTDIAGKMIDYTLSACRM